jgi:hypothetical protein
MNDHDTVARAFALARDSSCRSVDDIRRQLSAERYSSVEAHLAGATIRKQLKALLAERR